MKTRLTITSILAAFIVSAIAQTINPQVSRDIMRECGHIDCPFKTKVVQTNDLASTRPPWKMTAEERKAEYEAWALKRSNELKAQEISEFTKAVSWEVTTTTNDIKILVCTDVLPLGHGRSFVFREFHFSKDGRLLSVSPIKKWAKVKTIGSCPYE